MNPPRPETLPQLGRYRLIARLGEGGMAQVYLALVRGPANVAKLFVIKQLRPELAADVEFRDMFLDEVRLATKLSHPNIVQTYEFAEHEGQPLIAMEFLDGQPLHALLTRVGRASFPLPLHLQILAEVLAGLHYAHELCDYDGTPLQIVHRDVSPQNVFATFDGQIKLMDFGIAKASGSAAVTQAGMVKGKAGYIAPEQITLSPTDRRADLYSVGVMLWEAIAGRRLTLGMADTVVLYKRASGGWPNADELGPDVPAALADIVSRATAWEPADRYPSARAFRDDLLAYLTSLGVPPLAEPLGALVTEHFANDRAGLRALVDQEIRARRDAGETGEQRSPSLLPSFASGAPADASVPVHVVSLSNLGVGPASGSEWATPPRSLRPGAASPEALTAPDLTPQRPPRRRHLIAPLVGATLVLALGSFALVSALGPSSSSNASRGVEAPAAAPSVSPAASPPTPVETNAPPVAGTVQLSITARPSEAKVYLDGKLLGQNPFRGIVPHDATLHHVSVVAPGCDKQDRLINFADDVSISFSLHCRGGGGARPVAPAVAPPAAPSPPAKAEPGSHLSSEGPGGKEGAKPPKPKLQVDEGDPYAR
ncbi:MAG: protein kinase [Polyangiaceae bacterium]|nr:protein kinase [Polyangiaceae bacterium]